MGRRAFSALLSSGWRYCLAEQLCAQSTMISSIRSCVCVWCVCVAFVKSSACFCDRINGRKREKEEEGRKTKKNTIAVKRARSTQARKRREPCCMCVRESQEAKESRQEACSNYIERDTATRRRRQRCKSLCCKRISQRMHVLQQIDTIWNSSIWPVYMSSSK